MRGPIPSEYRCCFCLHVRTGTILFGTWQMLLQFAGMIFLLYYILFFRQSHVVDVIELNSSNEISTDLDKTSNGHITNVVGGLIFDLRMTDGTSKERFFENQCFALLLTTLTFIVTAMMVQGAWQGRSSYILPFFCLQIFDFVISCLTVAGFFSYDDVRRWVTDQVNNRIIVNTLDSVNIHYMLAIVVLMAALILTLKAYFICLVWACYKYFCEQERSRSGTTRNSYTLNPPVVLSAVDADADVLLPPKYEDVIKQQQLNAEAASTSTTSPPSYDITNTTTNNS